MKLIISKNRTMSITHGLGQAYMMWLYNVTNFRLFMDDVANYKLYMLHVLEMYVIYACRCHTGV
jgi:hypothetical protein